MRAKNGVLAVSVALALCGSIFAQQQADKFYLPQTDQPFEGKVETRIGTLEFSNQYPSKESVDTLLDSMDFHGATQAYLWGYPDRVLCEPPILPSAGFRTWPMRDLRDQVTRGKARYPHGECDTPYIFATPNLTKTGPLVIDVPAGALAGMVDDFWQRPITDIGLPGPDKGKGAKYLITPPGYKGPKPDGYKVFESPTNNMFVATRIIEPDPGKAKELKAAFLVYSYSDRATAKKQTYPVRRQESISSARRAAWRSGSGSTRSSTGKSSRSGTASSWRCSSASGSRRENPSTRCSAEKNPRGSGLRRRGDGQGQRLAEAGNWTLLEWGESWKIALGLDPSASDRRITTSSMSARPGCMKRSRPRPEW